MPQCVKAPVRASNRHNFKDVYHDLKHSHCSRLLHGQPLHCRQMSRSHLLMPPRVNPIRAIRIFRARNTDVDQEPQPPTQLFMCCNVKSGSGRHMPMPRGVQALLAKQQSACLASFMDVHARNYPSVHFECILFVAPETTFCRVPIVRGFVMTASKP